MIRGYFRQAAGQPRPYVAAYVDAAAVRRRFEIAFLVDTGADYTILAPYDAVRLSLDWSRLVQGASSMGIGGTSETSVTPAKLTFDGLSLDVQLTVLSTPDGARPLPLPSLLGRDVLSQFCLILDQATDRVLLLTAEERERLALPD